MSSLLAAVAPLLVGPLAFLVTLLIVVLLVLVIARLVFGLAWRVAVVAGAVLLVLWVVGAV